MLVNIKNFLNSSFHFSGLRSLYSDVAIYGFSSAVSRGLGILTFPLLARHFSVEDFGSLDLFLILISLIGSLAVFGQDSALLRYYFEYKKTGEEKEISLASFQMQFLWSGIIFLSASLVLSSQAGSENLNWLNATVCMLMLLCAFSEAIQANALVLMRLESKKIKFLIFNLVKSSSYLALALLTTFVMDFSLHEYFAAFAVLACFLAVIGLGIIIPFVKRNLRGMAADRKKLLKYAVPMGAIVAIGTMQPVLERAIVGIELDRTSLGEYAAAAKTALVVALPIKAFSDAFYPFIMRAYSANNAELSAQDSIKFYLFASTSFAILYNCFAYWSLNFFAGAKYLTAHQSVIPLVLAHYFHGLSGFLGLGTVISGNTIFRLAIYLFCLVLAAMAMFVLVPHYGITGVAIAVLGGQIARFFLEAFIGYKLFPVEWPISFISVNLITVLGASSVAFHSEPVLTSRLLLASCGFILLCFFIFIFRSKNALPASSTGSRE